MTMMKTFTALLLAGALPSATNAFLCPTLSTRPSTHLSEWWTPRSGGSQPNPTVASWNGDDVDSTYASYVYNDGGNDAWSPNTATLDYYSSGPASAMMDYNSNAYSTTVLPKKQAPPSQTQYFADRIQQARQRVIANNLEINKHKATINVLGGSSRQVQAAPEPVQDYYNSFASTRSQGNGNGKVWTQFSAPRYNDNVWTPQGGKRYRLWSPDDSNVVDAQVTSLTNDQRHYDRATVERRNDWYSTRFTPSRNNNYRPNDGYQQVRQLAPASPSEYEYSQQQQQQQQYRQISSGSTKSDRRQALFDFLGNLSDDQKLSLLAQLGGGGSSPSWSPNRQAQRFDPSMVTVDMSPQAVQYRQSYSAQRIAQARQAAMERSYSAQQAKSNSSARPQAPPPARLPAAQQGYTRNDYSQSSSNGYMGGNNGNAWNNNGGSMSGGRFNNNNNNNRESNMWSNNQWSSNELSAVPVGDFGYNDYNEEWSSDNVYYNESPSEEYTSPSFSPKPFGNSHRLV